MPAYSVYYLSCGADIFYVGCTTNTLQTRLSAHKSATKGKLCGNSAKNKKIKEYGGSVEIHELEVIIGSKKDAAKKEKYWINKLVGEGNVLCNAECIDIAEREIDETIYRSVKVEKRLIDMVRQYKDETYMPISVFIGQAIQEKFQKETGTTPHTHVTNTETIN